MIEFLIFGGFWFWMFFGLDSLIFILLAINDERDFRPGAYTFFGLISILLLVFSGLISISWIIANPWMALLYLGIYIVAGLIWSMKEWFDFVKESLKYTTINTSFDIPKENALRKDLKRRFSFGEHWTQICTWVAFFPYFLLSWALTDPIKIIVSKFSFIYNKISAILIDKALKKVNTK